MNVTAVLLAPEHLRSASAPGDAAIRVADLRSLASELRTRLGPLGRIKLLELCDSWEGGGRHPLEDLAAARELRPLFAPGARVELRRVPRAQWTSAAAPVRTAGTIAASSFGGGFNFSGSTRNLSAMASRAALSFGVPVLVV
jgi:hypothetical protein